MSFWTYEAAEGAAGPGSGRRSPLTAGAGRQPSGRVRGWRALPVEQRRVLQPRRRGAGRNPLLPTASDAVAVSAMNGTPGSRRRSWPRRR
jgi:hypothetical protein